MIIINEEMPEMPKLNIPKYNPPPVKNTIQGAKERIAYDEWYDKERDAAKEKHHQDMEDYNKKLEEYYNSDEYKKLNSSRNKLPQELEDYEQKLKERTSAGQTTESKIKPPSNNQPSTKKDTTTGSNGNGGRSTTSPNNPSFISKNKKTIIGAGIIGAGIGAGYLYNRHKKKKEEEKHRQEEEKKRLAAEAEARRLANRTPLERARDKFNSLRHR